MKQILIENCSFLVKNAGEVLEDVDLLIGGSKIEKIGKGLGKICGQARRFDGRGKIAAPGFVNTHTHLYQNMLKGIRDDLGLKAWCETVTFPFAALIHRYEHEDNFDLAYYYGLLGAMEMIHCGITTFVDMDIMADSLFEAWEQIGVRGIGAIQAVNRWVPKELLISDDERKKKIAAYIHRWHNRGLLQVALAPSTPFACTPDFLEWQKNTAGEYNLNMFIHVSETRWEVEQSMADVGMTPLAYLDSLGFLSRPFCAVHGVHFTEREMDLAREKQVTVCYNPKSNAKLGSGIAPVHALIKRGIPVCVATDGAASNDLLDIFEDMRFGILLQKAKMEDSRILEADDMYRMATSAGGKLLNLPVGELEEGKLADIIIMDAGAAHFAPVHNIIQQIVYCGKETDVETVIIGGRVVMKDRVIETVDETLLKNQAADLVRKCYPGLRRDQLEADF
ncbi:MAG: amidohydrolase [Treponema sp.]|jgi:5-methylthioadenosine/S-adenosylhomocysteine deaminase|nr:amidohydrolase [Treponema sp.]